MRSDVSIRWQCGLLVVLCWLCWEAAPAARQYRTVDVELLRVTVDPDWVPRGAPGYLPIRIDITNFGDARVIEILAVGSRYFRSPSGQAQATVRQMVRLEAKDRVRLTMPVPVFGDNESMRIEIREDNRVLERFNVAGLMGRQAPANTSALIIAEPDSPLGRFSASLVRSLGGSITFATGVARGGSSPVPGRTVASARTPNLDVVLEPARLPSNWLAYTSVRAVFIGGDEWALLADGQKDALLTWTASGGNLILVDGVLDALLPGAHGVPAFDPDRIVGRHFFGRVHVIASAMLEAVGLSTVISGTEKSSDPLWALPANLAPDWGAIESRGFRLPIPGVDGVPVRTFMIILLVFSAVIGPVSYWFLRRKDQLVLLVLTAPLISLVSIVLLTGYAIADEGFQVQGRAVTFTMLDQAKKQAATRATISLYAPGLAPAAGLRFPRDMAVFPIGADGNGARDRMTLDLTDSQVFTQGLLATRAPTNFEQASFRPARERLTFSRDAGGLKVTNGLDALVTVLRYEDAGTLYVFDGPLLPGGEQTLKAAPANDAAPIDLPVKFLPLFKHQPAGSYLALVDRSPFWAPGTSGILERGSVHVVLGWPEGQR